MTLQDILEGLQLQFGGGFTPDFSNEMLLAANDTLRDMATRVPDFSHDAFTSITDTVTLEDYERKMFEAGVRYFMQDYGDAAEREDTLERNYKRAQSALIMGQYHAS